MFQHHSLTRKFAIFKGQPLMSTFYFDFEACSINTVSYLTDVLTIKQ